MKISKKLLVLGLALVAGVAIAAVTNPVLVAQWFQGGLYVIPKANPTAVVAANKITSIYNATLGWNPPAVGGGGVTCSTSVPVTVTGAEWRDRCVPSIDLGQDGGDEPIGLVVKCKAKTNAVVWEVCDMRADAGTPGAIDLPDSGFSATIFGSR